MEEKQKTGLWKTTSQNNKEYCKGKVVLKNIEYSLRLFENNNKTKETQPDFTIYIDEMITDKPKEVKEEIKEEFTMTLSDDDLPF